MAISERIKYGTADRCGGWVSDLEKDLVAPEEKVSWAYPRMQLPEVTYVGVPMERGIKLALIDAGVLCGNRVAELRTVPHQNYTKWLSAVRKTLHRPAEIEFLDFAGSVADNSLVASVGELGEILSRVNELAFQIDEDEYGLVRPSYHAHRQCMRILLAMAQNSEFIKPSDIGTDHNGAIRIAWTDEGREAELVCHRRTRNYHTCTFLLRTHTVQSPTLPPRECLRGFDGLGAANKLKCRRTAENYFQIRR